MSEDKGTSPEPVEEPSGEGASAEGTSALSEAPEGAGASAKQETDWEKRFKDTEAAFQRERQARAEWEAERKQWLEFSRQVAERNAPQRVDPVEQAYAELAEAESSFDAQRKVQVLRKIDALKEQRLAEAQAKRDNELIEKMLRTAEVKAQMKDAERLGYGDANVLAQIHQTLTPEELAYIAAKRDGKLSSIVEADRKAAEQRAAEARRSASVSAQGVGGGRMVPGQDRASDEGPPMVPRSVYYAFPERVAKKKWPNATIIDG